MNVDNLIVLYFYYMENAANLKPKDGLQAKLALTKCSEEGYSLPRVYFQDFALQEKNFSFGIQKDIGTLKKEILRTLETLCVYGHLSIVVFTCRTKKIQFNILTKRTTNMHTMAQQPVSCRMISVL